MSTCKHTNFNARVEVNHLADVQRYVANITVNCSQCGLPFQFMGMAPGVSTTTPCVSLDGTEARMPIAPQGSRANPFQQMVHGKARLDS